MTDHNERVYGLNQQQPLPCNAGGDSEQDDDDAIDATLIDHEKTRSMPRSSKMTTQLWTRCGGSRWLNSWW